MNKTITKEAIQRFNIREETGFKEIFYAMVHDLQLYSATITGEFYESEAIVIKSLYKMWKSSATFSDTPALVGFLYKIVKNASVDHVRSKNYKINKLTFDESVALNVPDNKEDEVFAENIKKLNEFIDRLPPKCREVMLLHLLNYSSAQISEILHVSVSTVDNHKFKAMGMLRKQFRK